MGASSFYDGFPCSGMERVWKVSDRCSTRCGCALPLRTTEVGNPSFFITSSKQTCFVPESDMPSLIKVTFCEHDPEKWPQERAVRALHSWQTQENMQEPERPTENYPSQESVWTRSGAWCTMRKKDSLIHWFQVRTSVPRAMHASVCLEQWCSIWHRKLLERAILW